MRRATLITIILLFAAIVAIAVYQLVLATGGERRFPGPGRTPTSSPNPVP